MNGAELIDQVVSYKERVWTVYSYMKDGVFAYQGLKPFKSFDYVKESKHFDSFKKNIAYIKYDKLY
jgi:hypothetical protein